MTPWLCNECGQPIEADPPAGYIELVGIDDDGKWGGYPRRPTPEPAPTRPPGEPPKEFEFLSVLDDPGLTESPTVGIRALHGACDSTPDSSSYTIGVERAITLDEWAGWVLHLSTKRWMGKRDLTRMLAYWWGNRRQALPAHK